MGRVNNDDQFKFLISCIRWSNNGRVDFAEVAQECDIISKGAAAKRYERMMKAHGIHQAPYAIRDPASTGRTGKSPHVKRSAKKKWDEDSKASSTIKREQRRDDEESETWYTAVKAESPSSGSTTPAGSSISLLKTEAHEQDSVSTTMHHGPGRGSVTWTPSAEASPAAFEGSLTQTALDEYVSTMAPVPSMLAPVLVNDIAWQTDDYLYTPTAMSTPNLSPQPLINLQPIRRPSSSPLHHTFQHASIRRPTMVASDLSEQVEHERSKPSKILADADIDDEHLWA